MGSWAARARTVLMGLAVWAIAWGLQGDSWAKDRQRAELPSTGNVVENRYIVEIRLRYDGSWYRLNSGPRPRDEAYILHDNLRRDFGRAGTQYVISVLDLNSGDVVEGLR